MVRYPQDNHNNPEQAYIWLKPMQMFSNDAAMQKLTLQHCLKVHLPVAQAGTSTKGQYRVCNHWSVQLFLVCSHTQANNHEVAERRLQWTVTMSDMQLACKGSVGSFTHNQRHKSLPDGVQSEAICNYLRRSMEILQIQVPPWRHSTLTSAVTSSGWKEDHCTWVSHVTEHDVV